MRFSGDEGDFWVGLSCLANVDVDIAEAFGATKVEGEATSWWLVNGSNFPLGESVVANDFESRASRALFDPVPIFWDSICCGLQGGYLESASLPK